MVKLGCFDSTVAESACQSYVDQVGKLTRLPLDQVHPGPDHFNQQKYSPDGQSVMSVSDVQRGLKSIGFFSAGEVDGICGYRTHSAIRLFQEYVRSVEKAEDLIPDGQAGPQTQAHLRRWMAGNMKSQWAQTMDSWRAGTPQFEYSEWLALLEKVKQHYLANPSAMLQKVNALPSASGSLKVAEWDFSTPSNVHLIGIRREGFRGKFEDIFVLLIKGLVFKFQGSTEPGSTADPRGYPFLVQGQHEYHFGWHHSTYLALKPQSDVLVLRSKEDRPADVDLSNSLEANGSINVHWGGPGMAGEVGNWSEGCQVIAGSVYLNSANELVSCRKFAALTSEQPLKDSNKTRGAYNVLVDLVSALSDDQNPMLKYMLLLDQDMDLDTNLKQVLGDARSRALALIQ